MDDDPESRLRPLRERLSVLEAIDQGLDRWRDVLEVASQAPDADAAEVALRNRFSFTHEQARAVLDIQFKRVGEQDRRRIKEEMTSLRNEISGLGDT